MPNQPHIFLIMTDQQKASATEHYGNPNVRTPTWSRLAYEGVTYDHCYAQSPICTPSRASIMTGTYPLVHRVFCHQNHAPGNLAQLPELLAAEGYQNFAFGHYESERSLARGWHKTVDMAEPGRCGDALKTFYACGSREVGFSSGEQPVNGDHAHAAVLNDRVIETLDNVDFDAQPVFCHVAYIEPHPPYFPPKDYQQRVLSREKDLPIPARATSSSGQPAWHRKAIEDFKTSDASDEDIRNQIAAYYGLIEYADEQIARLVAYLESRDLLDDSWIILTSDHGDYMAEKGMFTKTETPYECLLHVPMVVRGPGGKWRAGERVDQITELLDIFPTVLELAGAQMPPQNQGSSLVEGDPTRRAAFSAAGEYHGQLGTTMPWGLPKAGRHPSCVRGARDHRFSYIRDPDYGDEAYDLKKDPLELRNLLNSNTQPPAGVIELQQQMDKWELRCSALYEELGVVEGERNFGDAPSTDLVGKSKK